MRSIDRKKKKEGKNIKWRNMIEEKREEKESKKEKKIKDVKDEKKIR